MSLSDLGYAHYEPATNRFCIRIDGTSPQVAPDLVAAEMKEESYVPPRGSPPYYEIDFCPGTQELCVKLIGVVPENRA